jgi:hypothetical protein
MLILRSEWTESDAGQKAVWVTCAPAKRSRDTAHEGGEHWPVSRPDRAKLVVYKRAPASVAPSIRPACKSAGAQHGPAGGVHWPVSRLDGATLVGYKSAPASAFLRVRPLYFARRAASSEGGALAGNAAVRWVVRPMLPSAYDQSARSGEQPRHYDREALAGTATDGDKPLISPCCTSSYNTSMLMAWLHSR